jgi:tRNA U34 5-methylaminomethyl-2-thiouridine-forming methyltransferase MnmC
MNNVDAGQIRIGALAIEATQDGSSTLIDTPTGSTYRALLEAYTESSYVFVEGTRVFSQKGPWHILEFGLGGGSKLRSTLKRYLENGYTAQLHYHAIERAPISPTLGQDLLRNHSSTQDLHLLSRILDKAHENSKQPQVFQHPSLNITLTTLWLGDFQTARLPRGTFGAVYHGPFHPRVNPEGLTDDWFSIAKQAIKEDRILRAYSAPTAIRRAMTKAGLYPGMQPGVGGKGEMPGASPCANHLKRRRILPDHKQAAALT